MTHEMLYFLGLAWDGVEPDSHILLPCKEEPLRMSTDLRPGLPEVQVSTVSIPIVNNYCHKYHSVSTQNKLECCCGKQYLLEYLLV